MPSKKGRRPKHKYRAIAVEYDGFRFDSKKEARRYNELKFMKNQGKIVFFLRQVPLHLPGRVIYRVDFQIFWADTGQKNTSPKRRWLRLTILSRSRRSDGVLD